MVEILVAATRRHLLQPGAQFNVVCAHSRLLLNICSTRTTAMRIKNAVPASVRRWNQWYMQSAGSANACSDFILLVVLLSPFEKFHLLCLSI